MPTAVDLFCGAGGLTLGLRRAGFDVLAALDSSEVAVRTYHLNFGHAPVTADVRSLTTDQFRSLSGLGEQTVDLVAGGPPCQGFSIQRIGGDSDERNFLVFDFARFVVGLRPKVFLMENVPGILGSRGKRIASKFEEKLTEAGYEVRNALVNAADYGVPQIRKRVFFYGWQRRFLPPFQFPKPSLAPESYGTVLQTIGELPSPPANYRPYPGDPLHRRIKLSPKNMERLRHVPPGGGFESLPVELRVNAHRNGAAKIGHRYVYGRLAPGAPAATITARFDSFTRGRFAHPSEDRNITLREGARLQTIPDDFRFEGTQEEVAALIGNAVPPLLAEVIGGSIRRYLADTAEPDRASAMRAVAQPKLTDWIVR